MRVLVVNKFGFVRGGLERVMFDEIQLLREAGHEAELFSTAHPDNVPARFQEHFPPYNEFGPAGTFSATAVARMFWNREAARAIGAVIDEFKPDVVHCHGIHRHLSPSVAATAHRVGVPVVLTVHDCFLVCPGNTLLRGGTEPCLPRRCGTRQYASAVLYRCVQGSVSRSALAAAELGYQRTMRQYERVIDTYVSPSRFLADVLVDGAIPARRVTVVPNSTALPSGEDAGLAHGSREGFLYVGRLSPEKGVDRAVEAARRAGVTLSVAGGGPLADELESAGGAQFLGHLGRGGIAERVATAKAVVVPSIWYENAPMTILEAMAAGTPVVASRIGGIPEQVQDGVSGILVEPGDVEGLAKAMKLLDADDVTVASMGEAARQAVCERFSPQAHLRALLGVYEEAGDRS